MKPNADSIMDWFEARQQDSGLSAELSDEPLGDGWEVDPNSPTPVERSDGRFFKLVNVEVSNATTRETFAWKQPMLQETNAADLEGVGVTGLVLLVRRTVGDTVEYLIQAKAEPGNIDVPGNVLLAPTVQASFSNVKKAQEEGKSVPLWDEFGVDLTQEAITFPETAAVAIQRKDGGRFYAKNNVLVLRDAAKAELVDLKIPKTHIWATREAIREIQKASLANEHLNEVMGTFA